MTICCSPKIIKNNLLIYLDAANQKSYPKYGLNKWGDISKNGNHFFMQDTVNHSVDSFIFDGTLENRFNSETLINHPTNELTIEMWLLPDINSTGDAFYSFTSDNPIGLYHYLANQSNLTIFGPNNSVNTGISLSTTTWTHLVRTSLRNTDVEKIYINGILEYEGSLGTLATFNQTGYFILGQKPNITGQLDPNYSFSGKMSIFKLYNKVLTTDEIKQNFNGLKGRFNL